MCLVYTMKKKIVAVNFKHIIKGWSKRLGIAEISEEEMDMAEARLKICISCPHKKKSKILVFLRGIEASEEKIFKCSKCGCPLHEKVIVEEEHCDIQKW